jgi:hypothetical protein
MIDSQTAIPPEPVPVTGSTTPTSHGSTLLILLGGLALLGGLGTGTCCPATTIAPW